MPWSGKASRGVSSPIVSASTGSIPADAFPSTPYDNPWLEFALTALLSPASSSTDLWNCLPSPSHECRLCAHLSWHFSNGCAWRMYGCVRYMSAPPPARTGEARGAPVRADCDRFIITLLIRNCCVNSQSQNHLQTSMYICIMHSCTDVIIMPKFHNAPLYQSTDRSGCNTSYNTPSRLLGALRNGPLPAPAHCANDRAWVTRRHELTYCHWPHLSTNK